MRLIETIEQQLLDLDPQERLNRLKDISYFIQCAASMKKAEGEGSFNPLEESV
jgi:hypothetical protein